MQKLPADRAALERFRAAVERLPFVRAVYVDDDDRTMRVWVITDAQDVDQHMEIFGVQDDCDPDYRLDVKVRTAEQYRTLMEIIS